MLGMAIIRDNATIVPGYCVICEVVSDHSALCCGSLERPMTESLKCIEILMFVSRGKEWATGCRKLSTCSNLQRLNA